MWLPAWETQVTKDGQDSVRFLHILGKLYSFTHCCAPRCHVMQTQSCAKRKLTHPSHGSFKNEMSVSQNVMSHVTHTHTVLLPHAKPSARSSTLLCILTFASWLQSVQDLLQSWKTKPKNPNSVQVLFCSKVTQVFSMKCNHLPLLL